MNPKTKIFYNGRRINGQFDSFKAKIRRFISAVVFYTKISAVALGIFFLGAFTFSTNRSEAYTVTVTPEAPILDRIADCESGVRDANGKAIKGSATHYRNGQVLINPNKNGSYDTGKYQVNSTWAKDATKLGLDLTKEADNRAMAEWIYANRGTQDWYSSATCWMK